MQQKRTPAISSPEQNISTDEAPVMMSLMIKAQADKSMKNNENHQFLITIRVIQG